MKTDQLNQSDRMHTTETAYSHYTISSSASPFHLAVDSDSHNHHAMDVMMPVTHVQEKRTADVEPHIAEFHD
jgi:hypothetical protein